MSFLKSVGAALVALVIILAIVFGVLVTLTPVKDYMPWNQSPYEDVANERWLDSVKRVVETDLLRPTTEKTFSGDTFLPKDKFEDSICTLANMHSINIVAFVDNQTASFMNDQGVRVMTVEGVVSVLQKINDKVELPADIDPQSAITRDQYVDLLNNYELIK